MKTRKSVLSSEQLLFKEILVGTLVYAVVLGFFNDYTDIVSARSFSTIFFAAALLELLTFGVFYLKKRIVSWLRHREGLAYKILMFFSVWFVMFISKFVFIWVIDAVFGNYMNINGFFGVLILVAAVTISQKLIDYVFNRLGST